MHQVFQFYADPGHGWMAVKKQQLVELGIAAKISSYSYQRGDTAYLEEDCDLEKFFKAFIEKNGVEPILKQHHGERQSKIRNYESYRCDIGKYRVVATTHNPRTDEGQKVALECQSDSLQAAQTKAKVWSGMGYWSVVYDHNSGEALVDIPPGN